MKTTSTLNIKHLTSIFDAQLLNMLKDDLRRQQQKIENRFINLATRNYDNELLAIIESDISRIRQEIGGATNGFAQAG